MNEHYTRAVALTAPRLAISTQETPPRGYWIDANTYFFLEQRFEASIGRAIAIPTIANCQKSNSAPVLDIEALMESLSRRFGTDLDLRILSFAEFDMPEPSVLVTTIGTASCAIDVTNGRLLSLKRIPDAASLYSPDGRYACFLDRDDIWLLERETGNCVELTKGGRHHCAYGRDSETNLAAVTSRSRPIPIGLWSPDSQWFLTHQVFEESLPDLGLTQHVSPEGRPVSHTYKYPFPGDPLPRAILMGIHVQSGRSIRFEKNPFEIAAYSPFWHGRMWFNASGKVFGIRTDRHCKNVELVEFNLLSETARVVLNETASSGYLDVNPNFVGAPNVYALAHSEELIWYSERDGWAHFYLYDSATGELKNQITRGDYFVRDIVDVDEQQRKMLFLAGGLDTCVDPARRTLCAINLDGTGFEILLSHKGDVYVPHDRLQVLKQYCPYRPQRAPSGISPDRRWAVATFSNVSEGNITNVIDLAEKKAFRIARRAPLGETNWPRQFVALAADGITSLHGTMFGPSDFDSDKTYPLIDYIYPGPQVAHAPQSYGSLSAAPASALAELGFITIMLDTRGTPVGSRAFHQAGYGGLLEPQLADHAAVVRQLCRAHTFIDASRVGMLGESAGAAAAVRALCDYSDLYTVAVAACGTHDPSHYSAVWADKYCGPALQADWARESNCEAVRRLEGHLLLITGDMDENVHPSQTLAVVDALIQANKDFDLLVMPNHGHDVLNASGYVLRRVWDYFVTQLLHEEPPTGFEIRFGQHEIARSQERRQRESYQRP